MNDGNDKSSPTDPWASCTFEGAELATLHEGARLTFAEKIAWLEEAHRLSEKFREFRRLENIATIFSDGHIEK